MGIVPLDGVDGKYDEGVPEFAWAMAFGGATLVLMIFRSFSVIEILLSRRATRATIAKELDNSDRYPHHPENRVPSRFLLRLYVLQCATNI